MRILAIRGCNLASLAGEFEIDLARGPLGVAGVFAIVGPTGAGKSTLLDAMCVALFDRTPRLPGHSRVTVGHGDEDPLALGAQDPRTLLRRGASQGWAEVDFESGDDRRYRARWSVRRARGATDGNLQDQQISLVGIDAASVMTERFGGTKTETLKAIHQRLGLTFDQFRRSALLAQGDFAAFLRAEGKDRSELLERMTGTEIYSKLSIAAHARAVVAEQALRDRQAAALAIAILADDARAATVADHARANLARDAARLRHAAAEQLAQWSGEATVRAAALAAAEAEHAIFEAEARGAEPLRGELALRRRAEGLRPVWDEAARLDRQHAIAHGELATASAAVTTAEATQTELEAQHARVADLHATIRAARITANIVDLEAPTGKRLARGTLDPAGARTAPAPATIVEPVVQRAQLALEPAMWLVERRALAPEIVAWSELEAKFGQERTLADAIGAAERVLAEHAAEHAGLAAKAQALQQAREQAQHLLAEATREADSFVKRRPLGLDAAGRAEDAARSRCSEVERLVGFSTGARDAAKLLAELDARAGELDAAVAGDRERHLTVERGRAAVAVLRDERARVIGELRNAAGYAHARTELVDGEPCPLCGAEEHPWKHRGAFDALIADAERVHAEAIAAWEALTTQLAQLAGRAAQHAAERTRIALDRATVHATTVATAQTWRKLLNALGELVLVADPATPEAAALAAERTEAARVKLEAARATRSAAEAAHKAVAEAQARVQVCQAELDHHDTELRAVTLALTTVAGAVERVTGERASRIERHVELVREVAAIVARWCAALPVAERSRFGGASGASSLSSVTNETSAAGTSVASSSGVSSSSAPAAVVAKRTRTKRGASGATQGAVDLARTGGPLPSVAVDRAAFAELVQTWHERAGIVASAEAALAAVIAELDRAGLAGERAVADAAARHAECLRRARELAAQLTAANGTLDAARIAAGFEREGLHRMLGDEPGRVDVLATELLRLDRAVDRARTRVVERRSLVEAHVAARPTTAPELVAELELDAGRVAELAVAVTAADHQAAAVAAMLAADDDARTRRELAFATFAEVERAAEVDRVLGQVIGSHDGKLFRSFAQSLTLDQLLAVANAHLEELAPRYQLERVPKHDLELQVIDRDFGGEVRSVQSLSGGESFLVSLALALGLSSMSAHDVRVRTLLIDEGFGTLDPATLDSALAVLDELQATGRQVGIISHVPALLDRVRAHVRVTPRGGGRSDVHVPSN